MSKPIKFVACGDNHGDMADEGALSALYEYCKDFKPDMRIHLGDCFDFRSLRRGVGNDAESAESLNDDIEEGMRMISKFQPDIYLLGNHEHRLDNLINTSGSALVRDYCYDIKNKITKHARLHGATKVFPYHAEKGIYKLGPIAFGHGYAHGVNAVHLQGIHYAPPNGGFVCGHIHRLEQVNIQKHGGGAAYSAGCLCLKEAMDYASNRLGTSRWGSGFAAGWVDGKDWKVWLVHKIGSKWVWQTDLKVWNPKK